MLNLCEALDLHEKTRPLHPALICKDAVLDHATLAQQVRCYAAALAHNGVRQGDLIGVALKDSIDHVIMLFAIMRLGAVIVPLDWRWTDAEMLNVIQHFDIRTILLDDNTRQLPQATNCYIDSDWRSCAQELKISAPLVRAVDLAMVLSLSSGTTGRPTGPLLTHAQFDARLQNQLATLSFNQHDRYLLATPLYFGGGRAFTLAHILFGATVIMMPPPYSAQELVTEAEKQQANSLFLVPTLIRRLLTLDEKTLTRLSSLRLLVSSGAPLYAHERLAVRERITTGLYEYYASTEGGGISVLSPADQQRRPDSVGRAAYRVDVEIVDDANQPLPVNCVGRIRYRGPGVAHAFYRDAEATTTNFYQSWFYPGDLGKLDDEGFLYLHGRSKDMIIRGGVNIYPVEIERLLGSIAGIADVAVFSLPDTEFGEQVVAAIVTYPDMALDTQSLYAICQQRLASYKIPSKIIIVDELPKNSAGKILKSELKARFDTTR